MAIRSSAVDEDGRHASFASQYETYLNLRGVAPIEGYPGLIRCESPGYSRLDDDVHVWYNSS